MFDCCQECFTPISFNGKVIITLDKNGLCQECRERKAIEEFRNSLPFMSNYPLNERYTLRGEGF